MKKMIICLMTVLMLCSMISALTLDDLDISGKTTVEQYLIENFDEITQINVEDLEGEEYEILVVGDDYIIIIHKGVIYVIPKR